MVATRKWEVKASSSVTAMINKHKGESCKIQLRVKYENEPDWINHDLWMVPGWEQLDIWKMSYAFVRDQDDYYYKLTRERAQVEEARLDDFKLV